MKQNNTTLSTDAIKAKLKALKIPGGGKKVDTSSRLNTKKDTEDDGYVVAGSLTSFVAGLSDQNKDDVINSTLLAQLAADTEYNKETETLEWYGSYNGWLQTLGWNIPSFIFEEVDFEESTFIMDAEIVKIVANIDQAAADITEAVINSLENDEDALELFSSSSMPEEQASFQICPCEEVDGVVVMVSSAFVLKVTTNTTKFLWWEWTTSESTLEEEAVKTELSSAVYDIVRDDVIEALGDNATSKVQALDL